IFLPRGVYDIHVNPKISLRMSSPGSFQSRGDVFMTGPEHLVWGRVLAICAAFLGFASAMVAFFVGVILGAVYGIVLLARRRATTASQIPLGTFLCIGGLVAALLGGPMVTWYRGFF